MIATLNHTPESSLHPAPGVPLSPLARKPRRKRRTPLHSYPSPRRGLSLIEVLVSIFVLTAGLLGVAMVIPAGNALMVEAAKSDRSGACGRAALNELQVRGWLDPQQWRHMWGPLAYSPARITTRNSLPDPPQWTVYDIPGGLIYGETYFLDPGFFSVNDKISSVRHFPYSGNPAREFVFSNSTSLNRQWPERALARRVTVPMPAVVADRVTTWADDLIFSLEAENARPRQMATWLDTSTSTSVSENAAVPVLPGDGFDSTNKLLQRGINEGRYTWAVMITPIVPSRADGRWDTQIASLPVPLVSPLRITRFEVSVIVFHQRNFYCPTDAEIRDAANSEIIRERSVYAQITGDGIGGGDVLLFVTGDGSGTTSIPSNPPPGYLNVRKNDWIMLKGLDRTRQVGDGVSVMPTLPCVCKWYRVVSVDEEISNTIPDPNNLSSTLTGRGRCVTLAGPDWQLDTTAATAGFDWQTDIAEAAIVEDVVGVYTSIVEVNAL